ncbi:MAG: hypothetical protein J5755_04400, partial [Clostridia bacterium]|nr:hypothetical protein [Clostridia bacterium]
MNINGLLAYAAIDDELTALNREYAELDVVKSFQLQARIKNESGATLMRLNNEAGELINQMNALSEKAAEIYRQLDEAQDNVAHIEDEKEADFYAKNVEKLLAQLNALANDVNALSKRIVDVKNEEAKAFQQGREATRQGIALKPQYDQCMAEYKPKAAAIKERLAEAGKGLDEEVKRYSTLKAGKIKNPIVPLFGSSCKGCFTEIDANSLNMLDTNGFTHNTGSRTLDAVRYLYGKGANAEYVHSFFDEDYANYVCERSFSGCSLMQGGAVGLTWS